jgi:transcriptional regulator with XRE-family HTH domain
MTGEKRAVNFEDWSPPTWPKDFGERLARLLEMCELSRQDLAELAGVTERTVQKWLAGGRPTGPKFWGIVQLARTVPGGFELIMYGEAGSDVEAMD